MIDIPSYEIIRSRRKSLSIEIGKGGELIVKAPYLMPKFMINSFINEKQVWINKHINMVKKYSINQPDSQKNIYPYLGTDYVLNFGNFEQINVTNKLNFPKFLQFRIKKELLIWFQTQAKNIITERVEYYSREMKTDYMNISFSDTKSKWGSCSHDNKLQFNWRLVMAPLLIIDYVVVHELVHTKIKNHQRSFWHEVEKIKPAYKQYKKWLHSNSHRLHSI
jgi:predicted metal-dependent hydrolase